MRYDGMCLSRISSASRRAPSKRRKVTAAEPRERNQVKLLVDIERRKRGLKFLQSRIVPLGLQNVDIAVVGRVRSRLWVRRSDFFYSRALTMM